MSFEVGTDRQHLRALSHPTRLQVLSLLTGSTMSSTELAKDMGMSQAAVSFHVRQLADAGLIELAETRSVRGGQEKRYRLASQQETDGRADMLSNAAAASSEVRRRLLEGKPARWDLFSDVDIWVDEQTWIRCARAVADAMTALHEAATDKSAEGAIKVSATSLLFRYSTTRARRGTRRTSARATAPQGTVKKPKQVRMAPSSSSRGRGVDT